MVYDRYEARQPGFTGRLRGTGACGHPHMHAHVGDWKPSKFSPRIPLPLLSPVEAIDWILTALDPAWEPAPWPPRDSGDART